MDYSKPHMLRDPETVPYDMVKDKLSNLENKTTQALCCFLYASGCRISEAIQVKRKHLYIQTIKDKDYLTIKAVILKKGQAVKLVYRQALVGMDETWLVRPILSFAEPLLEDDVLFPVCRATAYRHIMKAVGWNPHGFRSLRATHLAVKYKFTDQQLVRFFGWANSTPASVYTKLNVEDIAY